MSTENQKQLAQFAGILKTFKDIEAKLQIGKNTPTVIAKVISIELFSSQINKSKDFSPEDIQHLKAGTANRKAVINAKKFILALADKVIAQLNQLISGMPVSAETEEDKLILGFINRFTQNLNERAAASTKTSTQSQDTEKLELAKAGQFYCSYFSQSALKQMQEHLKTGHMPPVVKRYLSVCFIDLVGFSTMSESITDEKIIDVLNYFFNQLHTTIKRFNGDIDKFIGDAMLVTFESAEEAVRCAIEIILKDLDVINFKLHFMDIPEIKVHLGINSGWVLQGNIGSNERRETTVIGDGVNIASRVQNLSPPNAIWATVSTTTSLGKLKNSFEQVGRRQLKGRSQEVMLYHYTRKVPIEHTVVLYEPSKQVSTVIKSQLNDVGITNIIWTINAKHLETQVFPEKNKIVVIGPTIEPSALPDVVNMIEGKSEKSLPIIPIIKQKIDSHTYSIFEKLGCNVIVPFYRERGMEEIKNVLITQDIKEIPKRLNEPKPPAPSTATDAEAKAASENDDKDKGAQERVSISALSNEIELTLNDSINHIEMSLLQEDLVSLWKYSYQKSTMVYFFNLFNLSPEKITYDFLDELLNILSFVPDAKQVKVKFRLPHDADWQALEDIREHFDYEFME